MEGLANPPEVLPGSQAAIHGVVVPGIVAMAVTFPKWV